MKVLDTSISPESKRYGEMRGNLEALIELLRGPEFIGKAQMIEHIICRSECRMAEHDGVKV